KQRVDPAKLFASSGDPGPQSIAIGDVDGRSRGANALVPKGGDSVLDLISIARTDRDVGAFSRQRVSDCSSDTACAAEDDGIFSLEPQVHLFRLSSWSRIGHSLNRCVSEVHGRPCTSD